MAWSVTLGGVTYTDAMFANFGYTTYFPQMMQAVANLGLSAQTILAGVNYGNSFRNRIINGNFAINQRGYASGASLAGTGFGHDRWRDLTGSAGTAYTYAASGPDTTITLTAGQLVQVIEATFVEGGQYTLSWSGTVRMSVQYVAPGTSAVTTLASNVASPVTVSGVPAGAQVLIGTNGTGTLGRVQFEPGPAQTVFERRDDELRRCQRYYEVLGLGAIGLSIGGDKWVAGFRFAVPKRTTPTLSGLRATITLIGVGIAYYTASSPIYDFSQTGIDYSGFCLVLGGFSNLPSGAAILAVSAQFIYASAEL